MEIVTQEQIEEWLRIEPDSDEATVKMLVSAGVDHVEYVTGLTLRPYDAIDPDTLQVTKVTPVVPESLKHAVALYVSAHFDDRTGSNALAMAAIRHLCRPYWVARL